MAKTILIVDDSSSLRTVVKMALQRAGYRVSVIAPRRPGGRFREDVAGARVYGFPMPTFGSGFVGYVAEFAYANAVMYALALWLLVREGVDIVHAHNPPDTFFPLGAFLRLLGKRFVFDHHDLAPEMYAARTGGRPNPLL